MSDKPTSSETFPDEFIDNSLRNIITTVELIRLSNKNLLEENEHLRSLLWAILDADERGQGLPFSLAMDAARDYLT